MPVIERSVFEVQCLQEYLVTFKPFRFPPAPEFLTAGNEVDQDIFIAQIFVQVLNTYLIQRMVEAGFVQVQQINDPLPDFSNGELLLL
jgi:hypothetical protein